MSDHWIDRAQSAEARLKTLQDNMDKVTQRISDFKGNFGVTERGNGELVIDFDRFTEALGMSGCLELRSIIDSKYNVQGEPGKKPHIKLAV